MRLVAMDASCHAGSHFRSSASLPIIPEVEGTAARRRIEEEARASFATVLPWIGGIYVMLGVLYCLAPPLHPGWLYATTSFAAAIAQMSLAVWIRVAPRRAIHALGLAGALIATTYALSFPYLSGDPAQTVVVVMVMLGAAFVMLTYWTTLATVAVTLAMWSVIARDFAAHDLVHWGVNLIGTALLALVISVARIRALRHQLAVEQALRESEEGLRRAKDQAEAGARVKADFLATMSHEIRTPLNGIFGMTELALDTEDDGDRREYLQRARACADSLMTILNDVLDFSRIDAGRLDLERIAFDPRDVVDGVLDTLAIEAERKGLELIGCVDAAVPVRVVGDPGRVRQILINLGGNAIKFTEHGEVVIRIGLESDATTAGPDGVVLRGSVRDTGIGIDPESQRAIFEAFTQADSSMTRRFGGTGLGLAICQRLVDLMGGTIGVKSVLGTGSEFWFTTRHERDAAAVATPGVLVGRHVLVASNHAASARHLAHVLVEAGATVEAMASGGDGANAGHDAIVVDVPVGAPGSDLRSWAAPLLVLASNATRAELHRSGIRGALASKPVKARVLVATLAELLASGDAEAEARRAAGAGH
jgi:signal transduction histidine kinase